MSTPQWDAHPNNARWYGEVIVGRPGETDSFYGYADSEDYPDVTLLVPEGWELLEYAVKRGIRQPEHQGDGSEDDIEWKPNMTIEECQAITTHEVWAWPEEASAL